MTITRKISIAALAVMALSLVPLALMTGKMYSDGDITPFLAYTLIVDPLLRLIPALVLIFGKAATPSGNRTAIVVLAILTSLMPVMRLLSWLTSLIPNDGIWTITALLIFAGGGWLPVSYLIVETILTTLLGGLLIAK